jgi:hypothetical protein
MGTAGKMGDVLLERVPGLPDFLSLLGDTLDVLVTGKIKPVP